MFRQLTQAMSGATMLSARVMAKAIAVPADTALWAQETTNRKPPALAQPLDAGWRLANAASPGAWRGS